MILIIPVLLIQLITTYVFFDRHWEKMTGRLSFAVAGEIAMLAEQIEADPKNEAIKTFAGFAARDLQLLIGYQPQKDIPDGEEGAGTTSVGRALGRAMNEQVRRPFRIDVDRREKWVAVQVELASGGVLDVSLPQRRLFSSSSYIFLLWMIGASAILLIIAIVFMRNQIRPIRRLAVAAERVGRGLDIPVSFKPEGAYEVRQAARAFLDMHQRIKRQMEQRAAMLAGVSHDLRTPLTRMKLQAAMMPAGADTKALKQDIADMERMIDAYLDFVRGQGAETPQRNDLRALVTHIAESARRQGAVIETDTGPAAADLTLMLRPVAFERCLNNLVGNAAKYADRVWLSLKKNDEGVSIIVDDDGPGIPEDRYDDVFKPFFRLEESRNSDTGGVGLGLPIVQDVVHSHGGRVSLSRSPRGGLRVLIELPG